MAMTLSQICDEVGLHEIRNLWRGEFGRKNPGRPEESGRGTLKRAPRWTLLQICSEVQIAGKGRDTNPSKEMRREISGWAV